MKKVLLLSAFLLTPTVSHAVGIGQCCYVNKVQECGSHLNCDPDQYPGHPACSSEPRCLPIDRSNSDSGYALFYATYSCHRAGGSGLDGGITRCGCYYDENTEHACNPTE